MDKTIKGFSPRPPHAVGEQYGDIAIPLDMLDKISGRTAPRPMNPFFHVPIEVTRAEGITLLRALYPAGGNYLTLDRALPDTCSAGQEKFERDLLRQAVWQELERMRLAQEAQ